MNTYTPEQLKDILAKHKLWIEGKDGGEKADLRYSNLHSADLSNADLRGADLENAILRGADLSRANLTNANLANADLSNANLRYSELLYCNLSEADLCCCDLHEANLANADLRYSVLSVSNLSLANLRGADLTDASLYEANLDGTDLNWVNCHYTTGDIVYIGNQGEAQRSIILVKKTRMAFIGCFTGTFDEARKAIREKYGDKAEAITNGYGLTLFAMDAIEKE